MPPKVTRILYCNLNRSTIAHEMFNIIGEDIGAHFLCCSEPNQGMAKKEKWAVDEKRDVAQWTKEGASTGVDFNKCGIVGSTFKGITILTCYISPNAPFERFESFLEDLRQIAQLHKERLIIIGDFNAWSSLWGSRHTDNRGYAVMDWMHTCHLAILNDGKEPTYVSGKKESYIDLCFCSRDLRGKVSDWRVLVNSECTSDHIPIAIEIEWSTQPPRCPEEPRLRKFRSCHREPIKQRIKAGFTPAMTPDDFMLLVRKSCEEVLGLVSRSNRRPPNPWWNETISELRQECIRLRRVITRGNCATEQREEMGLALRTASKRLKSEIRSAKRATLERSLDELNRNPWGLRYRQATGKSKTHTEIEPEEQLRHASELFPDHGTTAYPLLHPHDPPSDFTLEELWSAIGKIKTGKAPGPDGIAPEVIREICLALPEEVLDVMNTCLRSGTFPKVWKRATLVLIPKPRKNRSSPLSFRPLCLLDTMGKVLEHLLQARLRREMGRSLSDLQYGFRAGRSTVDALKNVFDFGEAAKEEGKFGILVALDIKNAFNTAPWLAIDNAIDSLETPPYLRKMTQSYLSDRCLLVAGRVREITAGVPQGSILGPFLWCVLYNEVLEENLGPDVHLGCFADDLGVMVKAKTRDELVARTNRAVETVCRKLSDLGLQIAEEKTETVMIASRRKVAPISITVNGFQVDSSEALKYLGVWIGRDMRMTRHMEETAAKADRAAAALATIMPNDSGPNQWARKKIAAGIMGIILYAAPAWHDRITAESHRKGLDRAARRITIRVCRGYKTMAYDVACVLAGIPPAHLLARERADVANGVSKSEARRGLYERWQGEWDARESWTRRLIPSVAEWLEGSHVIADASLAHVLSGCGPFRAYLAKIGRSAAEACVFCYERDTVEHGVFQCRRFRWRRERLEAETGTSLLPETMGTTMLLSRGNWFAVARYVKDVMAARAAEAKRRGL